MADDNIAQEWESSEPTWVEYIKQIWGSFLISRDLHYELTTAKGRLGVELYLPNLVARQFGFIQSCPVLYPKSKNILSSWRQSFNSKPMAKEISKLYSQLFDQFEMKTFLPSSKPTPTFKGWWSGYSKNFFQADLNLAKSHVLKGVVDNPNRHMVHKRSRPDRDTDFDNTEISDQEQGASFVNSQGKSSSTAESSISKRSKTSDQEFSILSLHPKIRVTEIAPSRCPSTRKTKVSELGIQMMRSYVLKVPPNQISMKMRCTKLLSMRVLPSQSRTHSSNCTAPSALLNMTQ